MNNACSKFIALFMTLLKLATSDIGSLLTKCPFESSLQREMREAFYSFYIMFDLKRGSHFLALAYSIKGLNSS